MKKVFTLIAAAMMALGVSAGDYTAPLTTTWSVQGGSNAAGVFTDAETHYYNMWGTSGWVAQAYTLFSLKNLPADEVVTKATYSFYINCGSKTRAADVMVLPVGSNPADFQALKAKAACGTTVASFTDITTSYAQKTVDVTEQVKAAIENGDTCVIMVISNGQAGGNIYGKGSTDYAPALAVTTATEDDLAAYKIRYVMGENEVKEAENLKGLKNAPITLKAEQKADFYNEDGTVKYIYVSDDAESKTVSEDGSTVVTVTYRLAETFSYSVNAVLGDYSMEVSNGQLFEGDSETVGYPRYVLNGADLYEIAQGNPYYAITVSPTVNHQEYDKTYTLKEANSNVVFYAEAEDIPNVTPFRDTYTEIRTSNAVVGVADSVAVVKLNPGKYTLTSATRSGTTNFYVNGENILTMSSTGAYAESVSNEFIVKENDTEVYAKNVLNSGNTNYFDYVLIRKTGDYKYLDVESTLPDTLTYVKGTSEDEKPKLSDYVKVSTNAIQTVAAFYTTAKVEAGADKATAQYTAYASEDDAKTAMSEPGLYYCFGRIVGLFSTTDINDYQEVFTDTIVVEVKEAEEEPVVSAHTWDFTQWSDVTITNLKADAAASKTEGWSDVEKKATADANGEPTELSKDNCFWFAGTANADGELEANGQVIEELKGLTFQTATYNSARSIAIAVNYKDLQVYDDQGQVTGSAGFGPYNGASYFWLGGGDKDCFVIKNVKVGTTITMGVESHKLTNARGVKLMLDGTELKDPDGNDVAAPTVYAEQTWLVPYPASALSAKGGALSADDDDEVVDITVHNTNGCHIYFIDAEIGEPTPTAISSVEEEAEAAKTAKFFENGQIVIVKDGKKFNAAGAVLK